MNKQHQTTQAEKAFSHPCEAVHTPLGMACMANDAEGVRLLCEARPMASRRLGDGILYYEKWLH